MTISSKWLLVALPLAVFTSLHCGSPKTCEGCDANAACVEGACVCNAGFIGTGTACHTPNCADFTVAHAAVSIDAGVATTVCDPGYTASAATPRTCQTDETWSGALPTCTANACAPALTAPANGSVNVTTGVTGDVATYACDQGYTLSGDNTQTCLPSGEWSGTAPTCAEVMSGCTPNPCVHSATCTPQGATGYHCGVCDTGWSGANCDMPITCTGAVAPTHGTVSGGMATFGQSVTYGCDPGYTLTGVVTRACQANGTFSDAAPSCTANACAPDLVAPANGSVTQTTGVTGDTAAFSCDQGYALSGSASVTCLTTGAWSDAAPTCVAVTNGCTSMPCVHGTCTVVGSSYSCGTCDPGWTGANCDAPVSCSGATAPANGAVSSGTALYNAQITYSCDTGYTLTGTATRTCQADGSFSGTAPTCAATSCGTAPTVAHAGAPVVSGGAGGGATPTFGATAAYTCDNGYGLSGANPTCGASGQWSLAPTCVAVCGLYTDVVYRVTGTFVVSKTPLNAGNQTFTGLTSNASTPGFTGAGDTTPFSRPPPASGTTFTNAFLRLRYTNDAAGNPVAGPVSLVEWYFPIEATQTAGANMTINVDHSVGLLASGLSNCGGGGAACTNHAPVIDRPCTAHASGTLSGGFVTWDSCTPAPTNQTSWSFANARAATGAGCATPYVGWGNVTCNSSCTFVPAAGLGDSFQSWSQALGTISVSGTNPATATITMAAFQIPNGTGSAVNTVTITGTTVVGTQCGSTPGTDLTCTVQ